MTKLDINSIILDALQFLHEHMVSCSKDELNYPYSIEDVKLIRSQIEQETITVTSNK